MYSNFSAHDPTSPQCIKSLPCTIQSDQMTPKLCTSTITRYQASTFRCIFIPNYNMYVHLILNTPAGVTVFPSDNKTGPHKQNTPWLHSLFLIFLVSLFRLIFTSFPFFHSVFYPLYLYFSHFLHNFFINKVQACFVLVFFIYDLLLNSKSSGFFFKSVGKFHFINKSILWKLYVDFSMLASSIGKDINWQ